MIDSKKVLGVIPARGGSKGVPQKNIIDLGGQPMIAWTINAARKSQYLDRVIVSTEDPDIREVAQRAEADLPFIRPRELAADETLIEDVLFHALDSLNEEYDYIVLLQPTSPFRTTADIDACIERCVRHSAPVCIAVTQPEEPPQWMFYVGEDHRLLPIMENGFAVKRRRQELRQAWCINGAVFVMHVDWYRSTKNFLCNETIAYLMPRERSVNIDTTEDLLFARALIEMGLGDNE